MRKYSIFGTARRFYFDFFFHISVLSFIRDRKHYKIIIFLGEGWGEVYIILPYQIYSSYVRDYMANYIWNNIKVFPNAMKN